MADKNENINTNTNENNDSNYSDGFDLFKQIDDKSTEDIRKEPKTVRVSTLVLVVALTIAVVLVIVFAVLYFNSSRTEAVVQSTIQTQQETIVETNVETEKPTKPPKETQAPKKTSSKVEQKTFNSYLVTLYPPTYIYAGPGYNYNYVMTLDEQGVYTIVDECYDTGTYSTWGKLKSGVGWVNLTYTNEYYSPPATKQFEPYIVTTYPPTYIYSGPGYNYDCVMTLDEQGAYTIVEEYYNTSTQSTWGKLKSGVGWINLN